MYKQPREERVKTPLPEKLKNSFSFANQNDDEQNIEEEKLEEIMDNGNYVERANFDMFNQSVHEDEFMVQDVVPTSSNTIPSFNRNKLREEIMNQPESVNDEDPKGKKKRKKRRPKKRDEEEMLNEEEMIEEVPPPLDKQPSASSVNEETLSNDNIKTSSVNNIRSNSQYGRKEVTGSIERDLFADMAKTHYLTISPNDIIMTKDNEESTEKADEVPDSTKNSKITGPMSLRQKTVFLESK